MAGLLETLNELANPKKRAEVIHGQLEHLNDKTALILFAVAEAVLGEKFLLKAPKFIETVDDYLNYQRPAQRDQFLTALLLAETRIFNFIVGGNPRAFFAHVARRAPEDSRTTPFKQTAAGPKHLRRFRQRFGLNLLRQRADMARPGLHGCERGSSGDSQPAATNPVAAHRPQTGRDHNYWARTPRKRSAAYFEEGEFKMAQNGKLKLDLVDVFGNRIKENVDIFMRNLHLDHRPVLRRVDASKSIKVSDLHTGPQGIYQLSIDPPSYHPVGRFITIKTSGVTEMTIPFPVDIT